MTRPTLVAGRLPLGIAAGRLSPSTVRFGLAAASVAVGIAIALMIATSDAGRASTPDLVLIPLVGWSFAASGLVAWRIREDNRIGPAMVATAFLWFAAALYWSQDPVVFSIGHLFETCYLGGIVYVLLAFPSGHLGSRVNRALALVVMLAAGPAEVGFLVLGGHAVSSACQGCPGFAFQLVNAGDAARGLQMVQHAVGVGSIAATIVILVVRWRNASPPLRFAIAPVLWTGAAALPVFALWVVNEALKAPLGHVADIALDLVLVAIAWSFPLGVARTRFARSAVADLMLDISGELAPGALQAALARALHDPSLVVAYWLPDSGRFVNSRGEALELPGPEDGRTVTMIERDRRRIAALIHDAALDDERLIRSACAAAALALENERLQADLRAQLAEVQASRARIVAATLDERRRIERDLHDGTQQRLVSVGMTLGLAAARAATDPGAVVPLLSDARSSLAGALAELRDLSQGIHPGLLTERGLGAALEDLVLRMPMPVELEVRLPDRLALAVETAAYYVVAESLTNVAKHAQAATSSVRVFRVADAVSIEIADDGVGGADPMRGSGLRGLRDRIEALGGRLSMTSPPGEGTTVVAVFPCA